MEKCSMCSKTFPEETMHHMIQVVGKKAYAQSICPACHGLATANPNYYIATNGLVGNPEWDKVIDEAKKQGLPPEIVSDLIQNFSKTVKKLKK